jgi:hypothetical protein
MLRLKDRRRHARTPLTCPASLLDKSGRLLLCGRAVDVSPCGIRVVGQGGAPMRIGQPVWLELTIPGFRGYAARQRTVKLRGQVWRLETMGEWRSVIVILFETDFRPDFVDPTL